MKVTQKKIIRYDEAISSLRTDLTIAQQKYAKADIQLARKISINVAKAVALEAFSKVQFNAIPKEILDSLSSKEIITLKNAIEFSTSNKALIAQAAQGEDVTFPDSVKPFFELLVKFHPAGRTISTIFTVAEGVLYPIWDWSIVKDESSQNALQLAAAIKRLESKHPSEIVRSSNFVKNQIDAACNSNGQSGLVSIANKIATTGQEGLSKQDALNYVRDIIDLDDTDSQTQNLLRAALDAILESKEDTKISADVLLRIIGAGDEPSDDENTAPEAGEGSVTAEEKPKSKPKPKREKSELQKKLEAKIKSDLETRANCVINSTIEDCQPLPTGRFNRPSSEDDIGSPELIGKMGSEIGIRPLPPAGEFLDPGEFEGYTQGITEGLISKVCDENGNCKVVVKDAPKQ